MPGPRRAPPNRIDPDKRRHPGAGDSCTAKPLQRSSNARRSTSAMCRRASSNHRAGRLDQAEQHYRAVLNRTPNHPDALHLSGVVAFSRQRFDESIELIGKALRQNPNFANAHLNLGNALREVRRREEAADSYRRAIALTPGSALAYSNLGRVLTQSTWQVRQPLCRLGRALAALPAVLAAAAPGGWRLKQKGSRARQLPLDVGGASASCAFAPPHDPAEAEKPRRQDREARRFRHRGFAHVNRVGFDIRDEGAVLEQPDVERACARGVARDPDRAEIEDVGSTTNRY